MPYPDFAPLASRNPELAQACTQLFAGPHGPNNYTFIQDPAHTEQYGEGPELLVHPAIELIGAQANYFTPSDEGPQSRLAFAPMTDKLPATSALVRSYTELTGEGQSLTDNKAYLSIIGSVPEFDGWGWAGVRDWFQNETASNGYPVQAAYFVGRDRRTNDLVDTLAFPREVGEDLGAVVREFFITTLPEADEKFRADFKFFILHNERFYKSVGYAAASSLLMLPDEFRAAVEQAR